MRVAGHAHGMSIANATSNATPNAVHMRMPMPCACERRECGGELYSVRDGLHACYVECGGELDSVRDGLHACYVKSECECEQRGGMCAQQDVRIC